MSTEGELWHIVEAKRDDGAPTMFRIRELAPLKHLTRIFVVELPYSTTEMSRLPNAAAYRRASELEEQWIRPACQSLGWEIVGSKTEDGSFFLYMYGNTDPQLLVEKLSPFDAGLGFYDDEDPEWQEYATLRELLDQAKAMPPVAPATPIDEPEATGAKPAVKVGAKPAKVGAKPAAKAAAEAGAKPAAKPVVKAQTAAHRGAKVGAKSGAKHAAEPAVRAPTAHPAAKLGAKSGAKPAAKPVMKAQTAAKPAAMVGAKSGAKPAGKAAAKPAAKPAAKAAKAATKSPARAKPAKKPAPKKR